MAVRSRHKQPQIPPLRCATVGMTAFVARKTQAKTKAKAESLFVAEGGHGADARGAACGNEDGEECGGGEKQSGADEGEGIGGMDGEEQAAHEAREGQGESHSD